MALYKFKVYFEDNDEVYRVIEIKPSQKFIDFHTVILQSVGFDSKHGASFFLSDDMWKKGQEITKDKKEGLPLMKEAKLNAYINDPHQKILYIYDFDAQWSLYCELIGIVVTEDNAKDYPYIAKTVGKSPKQYTNEKKFGEGLEEDEFEYITRNLLAGDVGEDELKELEGFGTEGEGETEEEDIDTPLFDDDVPPVVLDDE